MKNLLVSILCLGLLIVPWLIYDSYSTKTLNHCTYTLEEEVIPAIKTNEWKSAEESYAKIEEDWSTFEAVSEYFLDTQSVNEADELINKTKYHIIMYDNSNAAACSAELVHQLNYLHENEILSFGNVF